MKREIFIQAALKFLNIPYRWGGDDPMKGLDCSGLVQELLAMLGLDPAGDQSAQALYNHFKNKSRNLGRTLVEVSKYNNTGFIVFYGAGIDKITHVAMILDHYTMIEAGGGGSKTINADVASEQNAFIRLRPYDRRPDIVAILEPVALYFY